MKLSDEEVVQVLTCIRQRAGLVLEPEKRYLVEDRLQKLVRALGTDIDAVMCRVRAGDDAMCQEVAEAMCIQETYFFRDPWLFESLREDVIPALLEKRARDRRLDVWCAACATGQEVWSIAMLLASVPALADWDVRILGSDFSLAALERARAGRYSHMEVNRGLPARELAMHFRRKGLEWEVGPELRRMVTFQAINLVESWPELSAFDIVLLRNVLIYFDTGTRRDVLERVQRVMRSDGFLFLGGCETPLGVVDSFNQGMDGHSYYYRPQEVS